MSMENRLYYAEVLPDYITTDAPAKLLAQVPREPMWTADPSAAKRFKTLDEAMAVHEQFMQMQVMHDGPNGRRMTTPSLPPLLEQLRRHFCAVYKHQNASPPEGPGRNFDSYAPLRFCIETTFVEFVDHSMLSLRHGSSEPSKLPF